jgi:hypothetical protein
VIKEDMTREEAAGLGFVSTVLGTGIGLISALYLPWYAAIGVGMISTILVSVLLVNAF